MRSALFSAAIVLACSAPALFAQNPNTATMKTVDVVTVYVHCQTPGTDCSTNADLRRVEAFVGNPLAGGSTPPTRAQIDAAFAAITVVDTTAMLSGFTTHAPDLVGLAGFRGATLASGAGGALSFPNVALAVTDFLINRAKAELAQSTFMDIERALSSGDLSILLPTTRSVLRDVDMIGYRALLPTFRAGVRKDLRDLPLNIVDDRLSFYPSTGVPDEIRLLSAVASTLVRLDSGEDVLGAVAELRVTSSGWPASSTKDVTQLAGAVAAETQAASARASMTNSSAGLLHILRTPRSAGVFVAFLLEDTQLTPALATGIRTDVTQLLGIVSAVNTLHTTISNAQPVFGGAAIDPDDAAAQIVARVAAVVLAGAPLVTDRATAERIRADVRLALDIWKAVRTENYAAVVALVVSRLPTSGVDPTVMRIITFASAVASVQDTDELTAAIEAFVDPVGSFRSRRVGGTTKVSVVSYLGFSTGRESVESGAADNSAYAGAFAPIGIEFSYGTGRAFPSSIGLYASFVDLGTLVSYRFSDDKTVDTGGGTETIDAAPDISWQHIVSPAAHIVLGITRDHPISLGIGAQRAPALRALGSGETVDVNRFSIFVGVDLTLLRF